MNENNLFIKIKNLLNTDIIKKCSFIICSICILSFVFSVRFFMYSKSEHPTGLDGYYYALQAKSFAEYGCLENPDIETGYYLCGIFAKVFNDPIKGIKIYDAASSVLLSAGIFIIIYLISKNLIFSLFSFFMSAVSPALTLLGINYINNQTGLMFFFYFIALFIYINQTFKNSSKTRNTILIFLDLILFSLCCISHKVTFIYSLFFIFIYLLSKSKKILSKILKNKILFSLICLFSVCLILLISLFFIKHLPRFQDSFSLLNISLFKTNFIIAQFTKYGIFEIFFYYILIYFFSIYLSIKNKRFRLFLIFIPFIFFLFWNLKSSMGTRMVQNSMIIAVPVLFYLVWNIFNLKIRKINSIFSTLIFVLLLFLFSRTPLLYNQKKDPPYDYYKKVISNIELNDNSLLIAHLGLNHVYTYYKNLRDCLNWNCDFEVQDNDIWRLAYGANETRIKEILKEYDENQIQTIDLNYILIKEDLWQQYLLNEDAEIAETFNNFYNPYKTRPEYIRKKSQ